MDEQTQFMINKNPLPLSLCWKGEGESILFMDFKECTLCAKSKQVEEIENGCVSLVNSAGEADA